MIDTTLDLRSDACGKDPDTWSPTARDYHQRLWSKPLPCGVLFDFTPSVRRPFEFRHHSEAGGFVLSSDAFIPTYTRYGVPGAVIEQVPAEAKDHFNAVGYTIGGLILWPKNPDPTDRRWTINQARGCRKVIGDRMDLTLECIRRHYRSEESPLDDVLGRYRAFFRAFETFESYVDFWLLDDLVDDARSAVRFLAPFDNFGTSAFPQSVEAYLEYQRRSIEFVGARNERMASALPR